MAKKKPAKPSARQKTVQQPFEEAVLQMLEDIRFHMGRDGDSIDAQLRQIKLALKRVSDAVAKLAK